MPTLVEMSRVMLSRTSGRKCFLFLRDLLRLVRVCPMRAPRLNTLRSPVQLHVAAFAVEQFGQHSVAELSYLIGLYCMVSVTLNTYDVPVPE
jgi:hypothetical protein